MPSVADAIVARLRDAGVRVLFGVPGGGSLDLIAAAGRARLPFVLTAAETAAAIAAIAQAEITGAPGACLTTIGPGVASVVNGVACARLERAPLLVLTDAATQGGVRSAHQRLDHRALLGPIAKWSATVLAANAVDTVAEAIRIAMAHPRGPVHLDCPSDVLSAEFDGQVDARAGAARDAPEPAGDAAFDSLIAGARRPLLLVGLGAREATAAAAIRELCASRGVPALVTYKGKGVMPDADPHFAGVFTNGSIEAPLVEQADALIGVGLDPVEVIPRPWAYAQPVVDIAPYHVEADHVPFAAQRIGDVAAGVRRTAQRLTRSTWDLDAVRRFVDAQRRTIAATTTASAGRLAPHRVVELVAHAAPGNRVTVDAGAHMFPATLLWPVAEPNGMLISNGLSTMGFALPAAIGAALLERERVEAGRARHDRPVVALTGDGGLLMCAGELVTAVRERLRVVVVVFNDASLSLIDVKQQQRRLEPAGVRIGDVDWRALGESVGMRAHHAPTEAALVGAVADAMRQDGPTLIDVRIDAASYAPTLIAVRGG